MTAVTLSLLVIEGIIRTLKAEPFAELDYTNIIIK